MAEESASLGFEAQLIYHCCVTVGKALDFSEPSFLPLSVEGVHHDSPVRE